MTVYCYLTFPTTYFAIRAEQLLKDKPYPFKMVPVPRSISSSCGTALRCSCEERKLVKDLLLAQAVEIEGDFRVEEQDLKLPRLFSRNERAGS
jgi:hypothetical protein